MGGHVAPHQLDRGRGAGENLPEAGSCVRSYGPPEALSRAFVHSLRAKIGTGQAASVSGRPSRPSARPRCGARAYAGGGEARVKDLAQTPGFWTGLSRRGGEGDAVRDLSYGLRDKRHRDCGRSHPSRHGWKRAAARAPWPPVRSRSCARSGSRASPWSDKTAVAASHTGWRATFLLPWSSRCAPGARVWEAAPRADRRHASLDAADLSEADRLGADVRGADLSGANLCETALEIADLTDCCGAHHARREHRISKEGYGAGLAGTIGIS